MGKQQALAGRIHGLKKQPPMKDELKALAAMTQEGLRKPGAVGGTAAKRKDARGNGGAIRD